MLNRIGRGLSPTTKRTPFPSRFLNFASTLPAEVTFTRNSKASCRNAEGKLIEVGVNEPRLDHTEDGIPLGLYIEHQAENKCENHNVNPTDTSQTLDNGQGILSIVDDSAELASAGLDEICTSGNVYKAEATSGSTFIVYFLGNTNNTNKHSMSLYARGEGASGTCGRLALGGSELPIAEAGENYQRFKYEDLTPDGTGRKFTIAINGNSTLYFILNQLEEGSECTSVIPVEGTSVIRPTDRARILNADQKDWFDVNKGYMICCYTMERLLSSDACLAIFNNGSSSNTIGYRVEGSSKTLKGYVRSASSSQHANTNDDTQLANVLNTAGIRWNNTDIDILSGGSVENRTMSNLPIGIDELEIGARNGGSGPIYGHILSLEIGTEDITLSQLGNKMQTSNDICVIGGGQSLIRGYFISQEDNSENGKQTLRQLIGETEKEKPFVFIDGSTGGSAACKTTDVANYWWDNTTNRRGPAFDTFYDQINPVGAKPTAILWAQGEQDGHVMGVHTTATEYKDALIAIFQDMRNVLGPIPIYIQKIGRRVGSYSNFGGIQTVRDIQSEIIAENNFIFDATETCDLPLFDDVHLTNVGYDTAATRNSLAVLNQDGALGPKITNAVRAGTSITVTLDHDTGTDFTPTSGIEGFKFFDNGSEITITSAVRLNANTITLTLNNAPSGTETLYYGYDDIAGVNINNMVTDNAVIPMPLRLSKIEL
jgi:hypothetical protein